MANIKVIAEHSVDLDLLTGGICIDVGCRGFQFSEAMRDLGCTVYAFDLEDMKVPEGIDFLACAIGPESGRGFYVETNDQQAKYISNSGIPVRILSINEIYEIGQNKGKDIDCLKLDCEGYEYKILSDPRFSPIPKQISVEFHEHAHKGLHDQYFDACIENLQKHYVPVKHERYAAHGAGMNWWDSLFIRKDLFSKPRYPKPNESTTSIKTR